MYKILLILIIGIFFILIKRKNVVNVETIENNFMKDFNIYGDELFKIFGVLGLLRSIYRENPSGLIKNFTKIKKVFTYKYGDMIFLGRGNVNFGLRFKQMKYLGIKHGYVEVSMALDSNMYVVFNRIFNIFDYTKVRKDKSKNYDKEVLETIKGMKLNYQNNSFIRHLCFSNLKDMFCNGLGYCYCFQDLIDMYGLNNAINIVKRYDELFFTKYGEDLWIEKIYKKEYIHYFNTMKDTYRIGRTTSENNDYLKNICNNNNIKCDYFTVMMKIRNISDLGGGIAYYTWFNNIFKRPMKKIGIIFIYNDYIFGSGYESLD